MSVKKRFCAMVLMVFLAGASFTGCAGQFALFNRAVPFVGNLGGRWVGAVVYWIIGLPIVVPITLFLDGLIFNTIEFWTGSNPLAMGDSNVFIAGDTFKQTDGEGNHLAATRNEDGSLSLKLTKVSGEIIEYLLQRDGNDVKLFDADGILISSYTVAYALGN